MVANSRFSLIWLITASSARTLADAASAPRKSGSELGVRRTLVDHRLVRAHAGRRGQRLGLGLLGALLRGISLAAQRLVPHGVGLRAGHQGPVARHLRLALREQRQ